MRHLLLKWATCITFMTCLAFTAHAEANFIYIMGHDNDWMEPCISNADFFAGRKLYETSPGSNVYEGKFFFYPTSFFRFIYELPDVDAGNGKGWKRNVIAPFADSYALDALGKSGLYSSSQVVVEEICSPYKEPGTWKFVTGRDYNKEYKVIVNLKVNKIFLVPVSDNYYDSNVVVVPDGMPTPTLDNAADYIATGKYNEYIPAGKLSFNYYDLCEGKWWNNSSTTELTNGDNQVSYGEQASRGAGYVKSDWKGGVVRIPYPAIISLSENSGTAAAQDVMYVHRSTDSFTPWQGASNEIVSKFDVLRPDGEGNYTATITLSRGEKVNFISALGGTQAANKVICPPADRAMNFNDFSGLYYSSAVTANQSEGAYWIAPDVLRSSKYTITVTPGAKPVVKFEGEKSTSEIYLVGSPTGWNISNGSMPLKKTVNGGYYGAYDIEASPLFRFYTSLGNWDEGSLGSQYDDGPVEFNTVDQETSYRLYVGGKGAFQFSDWTGGMMYMYVEPSASRVTFSTSPIAAAGEYLEDANIDPKGKEGLYRENGQEVSGRDGVYWLSLNVQEGNPEVVKLYTYKLPISRDEAEAEGSYALTLPDGFEWKFDEMGVAEATYTVQEGVTTAIPNHITIKNPEGATHYNYNLCIDTNTHKIYLERIGTALHLFGAITDGEVPSYADRANFRQFALSNGGGFVDVPKDKLDFVIANSIADAMALKNGTLTPSGSTLIFEEGVATFNNYSSAPYAVTIKDWTGGRVFVSANTIMDARNLSTIYGFMRTSDGGMETSALTEATPGSMVYEGDVTFENAQNPYLYFALNNNILKPELIVEFASPAYYSGIGYAAMFEKSQNLIAKNGVMSSGMRFGGNSFKVPAVKGNGSLKVKIDLNRMEMTAELSPENKASVYESVSDCGSLDQIVASESSEMPDVVAMDAQLAVNAGESAEFNFASPDGELLVPASGTPTAITFGADGMWEGDFVKVGTPVRARNAARKAASANSAKWSMSLPEGVQFSHISMLINEETKKFKVFSSAHKTDGFFILTENVYMGGMWPSLENVDKLTKMPKVSDGRYEAQLAVPSTGLDMMMIVNSLSAKYRKTIWSGVMGDPYGSDDDMKFTLDADGDEMTLPAWKESYASSWSVNAPAGKVLVTYDEKSNKLTVKSDKGLGCDDLTADNGTAFRIEVGDGCVTVITDGNLDLDFVNATGAVAKQVSVAAGTTTVNLAPGFYVVAGQKIFVR